MNTLEQIKTDLIRIRRHLHQHPELSHHEHETARWIAAELKRLGIDCETGVGGTGIVALIEGEAGAGPTVAMRADMDALPITEERDTPHQSRNPGVMHACGHDGHCAMVLGAARAVMSDRATMRGSVKLLFQPSEETSPSGAEAMVKAGAMRGVDAVIGLHVFPFLPTGKVAVKPGVASANADEFEIIVKGKGGHAGYPHLAIDPTVAAAHVVIALQTIASRRIRPNDPVVVTVGCLEAGTKHNVIPPHARLRGTFRTLRQSVREQVAEEIRRIAENVALGFAASAEVKIEWGCASVENNPRLCEAFVRAGERLLGKEQVEILSESFMGADDFSFFQREAPGVYFRLGTADVKKRTDFPLHHPQFDIDEDALPIGAMMLVETALEIQRAGQ